MSRIPGAKEDKFLGSIRLLKPVHNLALLGLPKSFNFDGGCWSTTVTKSNLDVWCLLCCTLIKCASWSMCWSKFWYIYPLYFARRCACRTCKWYALQHSEWSSILCHALQVVSIWRVANPPTPFHWMKLDLLLHLHCLLDSTRWDVFDSGSHQTSYARDSTVLGTARNCTIEMWDTIDNAMLNHLVCSSFLVT